MSWPGLLRAYAKHLPIEADRFIVTLHEGNTALVPAQKLADAIGFPGKLYLKCEGQNPTASFKDRGMTYAVSKALAQGSKAVICASTGNTSASAAAYAARAGMQCLVLIPEGKVALGKLSQAAMHGAHIIKVKGNFDMALHLVKEVVKKFPLTLVNSLNPFRVEGQKTAAFEICEALHGAPDFHALPVGNAGNICAYWKGYQEYQKNGVTQASPRMLGFQAEGAAPLVHKKIIEHPETIATAIRIGNPAGWKPAQQALLESKGLVEAVSDKEILEAYRLIASQEGVFCEPASAAGVAGVKKLSQKAGFFAKGVVAVCTLTGHGLKDPEIALKVPFHQSETAVDLDAFAKLIGELIR